MQLWEIIIVSIGLSLEAFTIGIMKGANQRQLSKRMLLLVSLVFGIVQTAMLGLGLVIGMVPMSYLDHAIILEANEWIAALILLGLGISMFRKARKYMHVEERREDHMRYREILILAAKTGIDVMLLGIVFGFLGTPTISIYILFVIVSLFVGIGLWMGERLGNRYQSLVTFVSGFILIIMSVEVVVSFFKVG